MIDTHAHLDFSQFDGDREEIIKSGFEHGLETVINIGTDLDSSRSSLELARRHEKIYATIGVHPHDAKNCPPDFIEQMKSMIDMDAGDKRKIVAIGEIGLDYYRDLSPRDAQRKIFARQLEFARNVNLPVVVHIREAIDDSLKILQDSGIKRGILHSFPGDAAQAKKAIGLGFFISFAGPITYPNSSRAEVASGLPLSRILTETDSPYLTPQAFRGKRNKPEYVLYVIEKLVSIFSPYTFDDMERITSHNARRIFGLPVNKEGRIVYKIRRSLYINLTNRCSNNCYFCLRTGAGRGFVAGHYLLLKSEPSVADLVAAIEYEREYDEVVFCGLGEPTLRLKELLEVAGILKQKHKNCSLRLDTNGHGSLINKTDVPHRLKGFIDKVSVSLNAQDAETYLRLCKPERGKEVYDAMLKFVRDCVAEGIATQVSVVELPDVDIEACRQIASNLGAGFRLRHYSRDEY